MPLLKWWKDSSDKQYTVSDATDATNGWGPLPVALTGGGVAATDYGKAEDAAHTSGDVGIPAWGVRNDSGTTTLADTTGDYSPLSVNLKGQLQTDMLSATSIGDGALGIAAWDSSGNNNRNLAVGSSIFNGTTWDRQRANIDHGTVGITAAGATTTQTGADQINYNHRGAIIVLDMTSVGTGNVTLSVQAKDALSGKYHTIFTGAAVSTNSTNPYVIYPGVTAAANAAVSFPLPRVWRVTVTANNANATTYTVGANLIL